MNYCFLSNKDNFSEWKDIEFTLGKRILWLVNLLLMILSIWFTVYCLIKPDSFGTIGLVTWLVTSMAAGYFCSPLKPFSFLGEQDGKNGCAFFLFSPLMWITTLVTGLLTMLTSWLFNLITILRKASVVFKVIACLLFAATVIIPPAVVVYSDYAEQKQIEEAEKAETELVDGIIAKVEAALNTGKAEKIIFNDDEIAYCEERKTSPIFLAESYGAVEKKISEFYSKKDFNAIIDILDVYEANSSALSTYVTSDLFEYIKNEITENGELKQYHQVTKDPIYSYGKYEVRIDDRDFIEFTTHPKDPGDWFRMYTEKKTENYDSVWVAGETVTEIVNS